MPNPSSSHPRGTQPLHSAGTGRLNGTRRLRTLPFKLHELKPAPGSFSALRFAPDSRLVRMGDCELEVIEQPLEALGEGAEHAYAELLRLTAENTPFRPGTYMHRHLAQANRMIVVRKDGAPEGFSLATELTIEGEHFLFINATMYSAAIRGGGLGTLVNLIHFWRALRRSFPGRFYVAVRTQNPIVLGGLTSTAPFYPRPDRATPARIQAAAAKLSQALYPEAAFDPQTMVQRDAIARDALDPIGLRHRDPAINAFCDHHLDYAAGDLFLVVAEMRPWEVVAMQALSSLGAWRARKRKQTRPS